MTNESVRQLRATIAEENRLAELGEARLSIPERLALDELLQAVTDVDHVDYYHDEPPTRPVAGPLADHVGEHVLRFDGDAFYVVVVGRDNRQYTLYLTDDGEVTSL